MTDVVILEVDTRQNQRAYQMVDKLFKLHKKVDSFKVTSSKNSGYLKFIINLKPLNEIDMRFLSAEFESIITGKIKKR